MFNLCKFELLKKYLSLVSVLLILRFLLTFITGQDRKMERGSIFDVYPSHLKDLFQITSFSLDSEIPLQKASLLVSPSVWTLGMMAYLGYRDALKEPDSAEPCWHQHPLPAARARLLARAANINCIPV